MRVTAPTPRCAPASVLWGSNTRQRSCRRSKSVKCPIVVRCRRVGAANNLRSVCRSMLGARSPGGRERTISCARALPAFGCAPHRSEAPRNEADRKSTRLNSSHVEISYAVFCLKKTKKNQLHYHLNQKKHDSDQQNAKTHLK